MGQFRYAELNLHIASFCNALGVFHSFPGVGKEPFHLFFAFYIILSPHIAHPVFIRQLFTGLNAQKDIMSLFVFFIGIVHIIGYYKGNVQFFAHLQQYGIHRLLLRDSMILHLQEIIPFTKTGFILSGRLFGFLYQPLCDIPLHFSGKTSRQGDNPFMKLLQHFHIHPGSVIVSFRKSPADNLDKVRVSRIIFRQKYQMVISVFPTGQFLIKPGIRRHIHLTANNGTNTRFSGSPVKINYSVHNPVIGNSGAVHSKLFYPLYIFFYLIGTVQKRIFCMDVQMRKCHLVLPFFCCMD